jgi:hypothetical protein
MTSLKYTSGAMWGEAKLRLGHALAFEAIAVVTDAKWVIRVVEFLTTFIQCQVKIFRNEQLAEARDWVANTTCFSLDAIS